MQNLTPTTSESIALSRQDLKVDLLTKIKTIAGLFKLRIVVLLLISASGGAILGAGGWPGVQALMLLLITGGLSAAGASA